MEEYDFNIDKDTNIISWVYNNKRYSIKINGLESATITDDKYIFIENVTENNEEQQVQLYTLYGEFVFTQNGESGLVSWRNKDNIIKITIDELQDAKIYEKYMVIVIIKGKKLEETTLIIYSMDGKLICEQEHPENYYLYYLTSDGDKPAVICEGNGKKGSIKYGRSTWKFSINPVTGELLRISVAY